MQTIYLSHSRVQQFLSCPSRFRHGNMFVRVARDGLVGFAADVGTALHRAMQHYMKHGNYDAAVWTLGMSYPWELYNVPEIRSDGGRTMWAALSVFDKWIETAPRLDYEIAAVEGRAAEELLIDIDLGNIDGFHFIYQMHIDLVVERLRYGDIKAVDIKTYAPAWVKEGDEPPAVEKAIKKYDFSQQLLGYALAVEMLLKERWDGGELQAEYWFLAVQLQRAAVQVKEVVFTPEQVSIWLKNLLGVCHSIAQQESADNWLRHEGSCISWGQQCQYAELCWRDLRGRDLAHWYAAGIPADRRMKPEVPDFTFHMPLLGGMKQ